VSRVKPEVLLRELADGAAHSGEDLARSLSVTRAAIWKSIPKLENWGLEIHAVPGVGYRLARPIDLLDAPALRAALAPSTRKRIGKLEIFPELDSTNRYLLESTAPGSDKLDVCVAEYQHAGRGRRGRRWSAPFGGGLCLSAAWQFDGSPPGLPALALAVGVVARRALVEVAGVSIGLKWPNDLVLEDRKLGGILLELNAESQGPCRVVAGIGINVELPERALSSVSDWPRGAIDLATAAPLARPSRLSLAARLVDGLADLFADYANSGFAPFRAEWTRADSLAGRRVRLDDAGGTILGTAAGIDVDGALVIATADGQRRRVVSGDVSVRSA
jgi:BirA family transcriptional regulator, biotin operon repressor / biotin---[acetyl-CoA-carboxylase] ligase